MKRSKMSRRSNKANFRKGARKHPKNRMSNYYMRGGIRL